MIHRIVIAALLVAFIAADVQGQNRFRRRGAIFGGLAGAAIGAAIGDKGDNETAGALIGGAVGAIAGGKIGSDKDRRIEHDQRYHSGTYYPGQYYDGPYYDGHHHGGHHHPTVQPYPYYDQHGYHQVAPPYPAYRQPIVAVPSPPSAPITVADVIEMRRRGVSESNMIRLIQSHGVAVKPSVSEVIDMHEQGVSEPVIAAMQDDGFVGASYGDSGNEYGPSIVAPSNSR